jgi:SnoaL-like domain
VPNIESRCNQLKLGHPHSSDAVLFVPGRPLKGPHAIKPFFQAFFSEFAKPGASFSMRQRYVDGDYAYILWSAETADNSYEAATDTFVVQKGKIVAQSFAAKITPKRGTTSPEHGSALPYFLGCW